MPYSFYANYGYVVCSFQTNFVMKIEIRTGKITILGHFYILITRMGLFHSYLPRGAVSVIRSAYLRGAIHQNATRGISGSGLQAVLTGAGSALQPGAYGRALHVGALTRGLPRGALVRALTPGASRRP